MRFLLDMGVSARVTAHLRKRGHDASHLAERKLQRATDPDVMALAVDEQRVLITFDLDFGRLLALQRAASPSVILFRLEQFTMDDVTRRLDDVIGRLEPELLAGAIVTIDAAHVRVRALPIW